MIANADTLIILDFETTGLSPDMGDRAIEIGAIKIENGEITGHFQELMHPGRRVSGFIANYTGITNNMLEDAAPCAEVMHRFADFIQGYNLVAHNASFDKRFLDAELARIDRNYDGEFSCSLLLARRIFQDAPSHKLAELIKYTQIPSEGGYHRALFDSEMTTKLWLLMLAEIKSRCQLAEVPFNLAQKITKTPKKSVAALLKRYTD